MSRPERARLWAFLAAAAVIAATAVLRADLFWQAWNATTHGLSRGGSVRAKLLAEMVLFAAILLHTLRVVPEGAEPRKDLLRALFGFGAGWLAEAWGTRLGLWRYYTGEAPPLWIVPAWPLGVLVVQRTAARWQENLSGGPDALRPAYAAASVAAFAVIAAFAWPTAGNPATLAVFAACAAALVWRAEPARDLAVLLAGFVCVAFADTWGTTNNCWKYWLERAFGRPGLVGGILFGACFDTTVVLACLKAADLAEGLLGPDQRS